MIKLFEDNEMHILIGHLGNKLTEAAIKRELIDVTGFRGIGKTYKLIEFAKKFNLAVIVSDNTKKNTLIKTYSYDKIYSILEADWVKNKYVVIDEGVKAVDLQMTGLTIVTGYYSQLN